MACRSAAASVPPLTARDTDPLSPGHEAPKLSNFRCQVLWVGIALPCQLTFSSALTPAGLKQRAMCELSGNGILAIKALAAFRDVDCEP